MTNRFREDQPQYSNSRTLTLDEPTDDPIRIVQSAKGLLRDIYRSGFAYKKAGVILLDLAPASSRQGLLFEEHANPRRREFVDAVEEMAGRYGMEGLLGRTGDWETVENAPGNAHPGYTTCWKDIPVVI